MCVKAHDSRREACACTKHRRTCDNSSSSCTRVCGIKMAADCATAQQVGLHDDK